tara:strand:- start:2599 stop:3372 length:774 start_codon:yes stop_codon:yes gene_type:complete
MSETEDLFDIIANNINFNDLIVSTQESSTETDSDREIVFANLKNYYVPDHKNNIKHGDKNVHEEKTENNTIDNNNYTCLEGDCKIYNLIDIDISFNTFSNLFYNNYNHHFNINLSNKLNKFIMFNHQYTKATDNLIERVDLNKMFTQYWCEKHNLTLNEMPPELKIKLTKQTRALHSLYFMRGTSFTLSLPETIDDVIKLLKDENNVKKIKCVLHSDVYMDSIDSLIRLIWPYNVFLNDSLELDELSFNEILDLEDM